MGWLMAGDPAVQWQVERDLLDAPPDVWQDTRARVATEGFGARLLADQDDDGQWARGARFPARYFDSPEREAHAQPFTATTWVGQWAGGAFFPAGFFDSPEREAPGQPFTATTWVLKDLREWGVGASALGDTAERLRRNSRWEYEDRPYWDGEVDVCINSFTLATGAWLGVDVRALAQWFVEHRLADGGWNCEAEEGDSVRSSFHSTLNAARGLLAYERTTGDVSVRAARHGGEEYLLSRWLLSRASTGEPVGAFVSEFRYPNRYRYSALAALDHFRDVAQEEATAPDPRMADAVGLVRSKRQADGRWLQDGEMLGRVRFPVDGADGEPSRWLTLQALRVLRWWDEAESSTGAGE